MGLSTISNGIWHEMNVEDMAEFKKAFVISDDMVKPKMSTPISDSVECQD